MNYIKIDNVKIELTDAQVAELKKKIEEKSLRLSAIEVGSTFKIGEYEFVVLEQSGDTTAVITKELLHTSKEFGKNNNYNGSYVDDICNEFVTEIADFIGSENIIEHTVDLTADDGLKCYGSVKRQMSLLTANLYRRYVEVLDKHKIDKWWWTATAYSTPKHNDSTWIKCVSPVGVIDCDYYDFNYGVRPFCILNSNILVSK